jgi:hypothetical protein
VSKKRAWRIAISTVGVVVGYVVVTYLYIINVTKIVD